MKLKLVQFESISVDQCFEEMLSIIKATLEQYAQVILQTYY